MTQRSHTTRLTEFFKTEYNRLVGFVTRKIDIIGSKDAADFVQEVAANLFQRADITAPIENLSAYVYQALRNEISDAFRSRKETISLDQHPGNGENLTLIDLIEDSRGKSSTESDRQEVIQTLYYYLDCLSPDEKALIIATELEGHTFQSLADRWQVSINTLLSRKSRAIKKLQHMTQSNPID